MLIFLDQTVYISNVLTPDVVVILEDLLNVFQIYRHGNANIREYKQLKN